MQILFKPRRIRSKPGLPGFFVSDFPVVHVLCIHFCAIHYDRACRNAPFCSGFEALKSWSTGDNTVLFEVVAWPDLATLSNALSTPQQKGYSRQTSAPAVEYPPIVNLFLRSSMFLVKLDVFPPFLNFLTSHGSTKFSIRRCSNGKAFARGDLAPI